MLELRSIGKRLGSFTMGGVSLDIDDGEYIVLLGPSGVGKTVLLEIIAGLIRPDDGQILWNDTDITLVAPEKRSFGLVYQDYALFGHLSVKQNIAYGMSNGHGGSLGKKKRMDSLAEMLGIADLLGSYPDKLSGGEQQRVALARALATEPKLLLLDEPLSALDTNTRIKLRKELKRINREFNVGVLHVTHDPAEAMMLAKRICVMLDGRIHQIAPPEELFRRPSDHAVAHFLGMKNILSVRHVKNNICLIGDHKIHVSGVDDSTSHIWIKPEEIILSKTAFDSSARNQFNCTITELLPQDHSITVCLGSGSLSFAALITYTSSKELGLEPGLQIFATFKSSAVHCF